MLLVPLCIFNDGLDSGAQDRAPLHSEALCVGWYVASLLACSKVLLGSILMVSILFLVGALRYSLRGAALSRLMWTRLHFSVLVGYYRCSFREAVLS